MKIWKQVPNYSLYEASTEGEIRSTNYKRTGKKVILKPALDNCGYLRTMLKRDCGTIHTVKVHRIICQTFLENPENKPCVNHKNSIRNDNRLLNLEWCTLSENQKHSFASKRKCVVGEKNPAATITNEQAKEILANYEFGKKSKKGITKKEIALKYNTSFAVIKSLVQRKTWKHLS
jgi:hypothetical protein